MPDAIKIEISAQPKMDELAKQYNLTDKEVRQIAAPAINRTLTTVRSGFVKAIAAEVNLLQKDIRDLTKINNATQASLDGSVQILRAKNGRNSPGIPLSTFPHRGGMPGDGTVGASVKVRKDKGWETLKNTFVATMKSGHVGIFERVRRDGVGAKTGYIDQHLLEFKSRDTTGPFSAMARFSRLPIIERFGLTLTGYVTHAPAVMAAQQANAGDVLSKNIMSQLSRRLAARKPV